MTLQRPAISVRTGRLFDRMTDVDGLATVEQLYWKDNISFARGIVPAPASRSPVLVRINAEIFCQWQLHHRSTNVDCYDA